MAMWMVQAEIDKETMDKFVDEESIALYWPKTGNVKGLDESEIRPLISKNYCDCGICITRRTSSLYLFCNEIAIDDYIISADTKREVYFLGKILSDYLFKEEGVVNPNYKHYRLVQWLGKINRNDLSPLTQDKTRFRLYVYELDDKVKDEILDKAVCF